MLKQLSVYAENKKGTLEDITRILLEQDINILGSMTDDGAEYGVNRMVVSKPDIALKALTEAGYLCALKDVIGVEVEEADGVEWNVHYLYLSFDRRSGLPIMVFSTDDIWEVEENLSSHGYIVVEASAMS